LWGNLAGVLLFAFSVSVHAADEKITQVEQIFTNPSVFHRHEVVLRGGLTLKGLLESKDPFGFQLCGPIFTLRDDTGEIPVMYMIRCDKTEVDAVTAMAGPLVIVHATIEAETVSTETSHREFRIRAMAKKIRREHQ
jgi:hypothetical protein